MKQLNDAYRAVSNLTFEDEEGVYIGKTTPAQTAAATVETLEEWTRQIDAKLERCTPFSVAYSDLMDVRFVTFSEFLEAHRHDRQAFRSLNVLHYPFYEFYMVKTYAQRRAIFRGIDADFEGYMKILHRAKSASIEAFFLQKFRLKIPRAALQRHAHIVAKTGQGKSNLLKLIIDQLIDQPVKQSVVLIEPHGDLAKEVKSLAVHMKDPDRLAYISPTFEPGKVPVFNPFDIADRSDRNIDRYSQEISKTFEELLKDGTSLTGQMDAVLRPAISTLLRMDGATLEDLQTLMDLDDSPEREAIIEQGLQNPFPTHRAMFAKVWGGEQIPTNYKSTINSIYTKIQQLFNTNVFYQITCGNGGRSTFNLEQLVNTGSVVVFDLGKGQVGSEASEAFGKFVVSHLQSIAFKRAEVDESHRVPTFVVIDEFQNYVTDSVTVILSEARKYGLHLILSHQSIGQITEPKIRDTLLGNTGVKIIGKSSNKTLRALSDEMDMDLKEFKELQQFEFYVDAQDPRKAKNAKPYRVKPPEMKGAKLYQSRGQEQTIKRLQLASYYTNPDQPKEPRFAAAKKRTEPRDVPSGGKPKFSL